LIPEKGGGVPEKPKVIGFSGILGDLLVLIK
jgi:hypothetical protein